MPMAARKPGAGRSFALVFSGGGARGLSHAGVLRALVGRGHVPSAIVGISMGAVVAATYALNENWFDDLIDMDTSGFPAPPNFRAQGLRAKARALRIAIGAAHDMYFGWGTGARSEKWGRDVLFYLTRGRNLEDGRLPVYVCATDMLTGERVIRSSGLAADRVYASAAIAGILPPLVDGPHVLMDGAYADIAPVDVARATGAEVVIAVDPSQQGTAVGPQNGLQAMLRSVEICQTEHARLRFRQADLVIRPQFAHSVGTLDFQMKRHCIAAGARAVRKSGAQIRTLLGQEAAPDEAPD
ncbi:MAG: hypothetical protein C0524_12900 [Rhodobacter sp.]|nr:hypothetical protein [Rhodobacter sp.]